MTPTWPYKTQGFEHRDLLPMESLKNPYIFPKESRLNSYMTTTATPHLGLLSNSRRQGLPANDHRVTSSPSGAQHAVYNQHASCATLPKRADMNCTALAVMRLLQGALQMAEAAPDRKAWQNTRIREHSCLGAQSILSPSLCPAPRVQCDEDQKATWCESARQSRRKRRTNLCINRPRVLRYPALARSKALTRSSGRESNSPHVEMGDSLVWIHD